MAPPPPCEGPITKEIDVGCALDVVEIGVDFGYFTFELTVDPGPIISGQQFAVTFEGRGVVNTSTLNEAESLLAGFLPTGFRRIEVQNAQGTVQVRRGAQVVGEDVVLEMAPIPKTCSHDEQGNTGPEAGPFPSCSTDDDCTSDPAARCGAYKELETSEDCDPGGVCDELGHTGPGSACKVVAFCVTQDFVVELGTGSDTGVYVADDSGSVLFGWADSEPEPLESGPDRGAWDPEDVIRGFNEPIALSGYRVRIAGLPLAFECIQGVNSRGPDGVPTVRALVSRSPDGALISCPIQEPD